jgi:hypothetical protein
VAVQYGKLISWLSRLPRSGPLSLPMMVPDLRSSPAPLALQNTFHGALAGMRAEPLQW